MSLLLLLSLVLLSLFSLVFYHRDSLIDRFCSFIHYRTLRLKQQRKPKRIILIRHGESQGNVSKSIYESIPDNLIELTPKGIVQSLEAGRKLRSIIGNETVLFYVSPFKRSRQTLDQIVSAWDGSGMSLKVREDPRIREQEWGNFQDPTQMAAVLRERDQVGRFFYRFKDGESGADVFDRVSSFMESLFREMTNQSPALNIVIVSHGLFMRLFLMRFYRWEVEKFHNLWNFGNCEMAILERNDPYGPYLLKTKLKVNQQYLVKKSNGDSQSPTIGPAPASNGRTSLSKLNEFKLESSALSSAASSVSNSAVSVSSSEANSSSSLVGLSITTLSRDNSIGLHRRFAHSLESSAHDLQVKPEWEIIQTKAEQETEAPANPTNTASDADGDDAQQLPAEALNDSGETLDPFTPRLSPVHLVSSPSIFRSNSSSSAEGDDREPSDRYLRSPILRSAALGVSLGEYQRTGSPTKSKPTGLANEPILAALNQKRRSVSDDPKNAQKAD